MAELRGGPDAPGDGDRPRSRGPEPSADAGAARQRTEPRTRAEYAAEIRRSLATERAHLEAVRGFDPRRANLPEISEKDAATYLDAHCTKRPWLAVARDCAPEVQRIFAAIDQGGGHPHIRHEGWTTEEMNLRRVAYLEDPAQLDPAKRAAGIDGLRYPEGPHHCRKISSRFSDPEVFAVAFARGIEHPRVRAVLDMEFTVRVPRPVSLPLSDLLGPDGHRYCTGWQLQPAEGSMSAARERRAALVDARAHGRDTDVPEPGVRPVETFAGGTVVFAFGPARAPDRYEVVTMYPRPRDDGQRGDSR